LRALYAEQRTLAHTAAVAVVNEFPVEYRINPVVKQVVNHPVAEIGGDNFTLYRQFVYEAYARSEFVGTGFKLLAKGEQTHLKITLEL
jgi:sulfur relay (sulfurtransferase) DsrC/TusE family protein